MAFPDVYYRIKIGWDENSTLYRLHVYEAETGNDVISELIKDSYIRAYYDNRYCRTYRQKEYSLEYNTNDGLLAVVIFQIWPDVHTNVGVIETSIKSQDCFLFSTDHKGKFEIYVFTNMKHKERELYQMMCSGDLNNQFNLMAANRPF